MQALPRNGAMAVVFAGEIEVAESRAGYAHEVSIAAINGPENMVVSGCPRRRPGRCRNASSARHRKHSVDECPMHFTPI